LISIQKYLNHSIPNNEVEVTRSFVLWAIKLEKITKLYFAFNFENSLIKTKITDFDCL